jgi:hypothetical protein
MSEFLCGRRIRVTGRAAFVGNQRRKPIAGSKRRVQMSEISHFKVSNVDHGKATFTRDRPFNLKGQWFAKIDGKRNPPGTATWPFTLTNYSDDPGISSTMSPALVVNGVSYNTLTSSSVHISGDHIHAGSGSLHNSALVADATWSATDTGIDNQPPGEKQ